MPAQIIELPRLKRARRNDPNSHVIYGHRVDSICVYHQYCAYTGDEPDLCSQCHGPIFEDDSCPHQDLPPNRKQPCFCDGCAELFTSPSAFDQHQRPAGRCRDPEKRGLVPIEQNGWVLWGKPGSPPPRES